MSSIVKCVNGHFYDAEKSKSCPYCRQQDEMRIHYESSMPAHPVFKATDRDIGDDITRAMMPDSISGVRISGPRFPLEGVGSTEDGRTVGIFSRTAGVGYVTGWLVGVSGSVRGRDYRIFHGINWIGRSYSADIVICEGEGIAELKQCGIAYDGKSNRFFIVPGSGTVTICNGSAVESPLELHLGDVIEMGKCRFEFVPFCREGHIWDKE